MKPLVRSVYVEFKKTESPALFSAVTGIPLLGVALGTLSFLSNQNALRGNPWFDLWTQVALFYGYFFYPLLISVIASYLFRIEHQNNNWNTLLTNSRSVCDIWFSKYIVLGVYALMCQILIYLLYLLAGCIIHLGGAVPSFSWWWIVGGTLGILPVAAVQLYLSMRIKSFALPSALCFVFCLMGLGAYSKGWWLFPYTLSIIGVGAQHECLPNRMEMTEILGGVLFWIVLMSILGIRHLKVRE